MVGRGVRSVAAGLIGLVCLASGCSGPAAERPPTPAASAVDLRRAVEDHLAADPGQIQTLNSMLVQVDGTMQLELYRNGGGADHHSHVWSVTKSVVSTLVGIAIAEGKISSLEATLPELLPGHAAEMSATQRTITLRQLLTMSAGIAEDDVELLPDGKVSTILAQPLASDPGTEFLYSSPSSQLVSAVVTAAVGTSALEYARVKLFEPLGISTEPAYTGQWRWPQIDVGQPNQGFDADRFAWATTEDGTTNACCTLKLRPDDMMKIGRLYLDHGMWEGRQLLPATWVEEATAPSETSSGYGFLWWRPVVGGHQAFAAEGRGGQLIVVVPETRTVITASSTPIPGVELTPDELLNMINTVILPTGR